MTYTLSPALRLVLSQLESAATARADGYTSMVGVATNTDTMRAARAEATPSVRAARHSGVDE